MVGRLEYGGREEEEVKEESNDQGGERREKGRWRRGTEEVR